MTRILIAGLPAAGKTTLSHLLADALGAKRIAKDEVYARQESLMMKDLTGEPDLRDGELYRNQVLPLTLRALAEQVLGHQDNSSVVIDGVYLEEAAIASRTHTSLSDVILQYHGWRPDIVLWLTVDRHTQLDRFISRGAARDAIKIADFDAYRDSLGVVTNLSEELVDVIVRA